jgi:hypothetical protein
MSNMTMKSQSLNTCTTRILTQSELKELDAHIAANANKWLEDNAPIVSAKIPRKPKSARGRTAKMILNPFFGFIGAYTYWERYPVFAQDIIDGVARLDWHDRPIGEGGKSMPLSVRNLAVILESLPIVTTEAVEDLLQLRERHARRYVKAIELIIPRMMKSRPRSLLYEMEDIEPEQKACEWEDGNESSTPSPEELAKLHHDLRTLTQYKTAEEYEAELGCIPRTPNIVDFPPRQQHPKKAQVLQMLVDGVTGKAIERETGVSPKTIRKWRNDMLAARAKLQAA